MQQRRRKSRARNAGHTSPSRRGGSAAGRRLRLPVVQLLRAPRSRRRAEGGRPLTRSASEPALWRHDARVHPAPRDPSPPPPPLDRPHTCYDVLAPDSPYTSSASASSFLLLPEHRPHWEEAKVVVNVTVEGSAGPVRAMVSLRSSIRDAIAAVVERYHREGRSPRLDPAAADSFQLHHSHFSLQSLNKNDKIGDVGGRNFYLHKNGGNNGLVLQGGESGPRSSGGEITQIHGAAALAGVPYHHRLLAIVMKKLDKIGRRTRRVWRILTCNCT